jgi:hypothetical protein
VIRKWRPSAFFRTDFEVFLDVLAIDTLPGMRNQRERLRARYSHRRIHA